MVKTTESKFIGAEDVAKILGVSESTAYRLIRELNQELKNQGKIVIAGKISKRFFNEKVYM